MKILIFSDIHGDIRALEKIVAQPADVYISNGDLSNFGGDLETCGEVLRPLGEPPLGASRKPRNARRKCAHSARSSASWTFIARLRTFESANGATHWAGLGYSNITPFNTPGEYSEDEIAGVLQHV